MNLFYSENFIRSVPREKRDHVNKVLQKLKCELQESDQGIFGTSRRSQTRKFEGAKSLFKFRVNDAERIIFTYNDKIKNIRENENRGIYLIEYVSHDSQNRISKTKDHENIMNYDLWSEENKLNESFIEDISDREYQGKNFDQYFDIEKVVTYIFGNEKDDGRIYEAARISSEQYNYVQNLKPLLLIGGAGSGKTLVTIHKANTYRLYGSNIAYFTLSENLCKSALEIYSNINADSDGVRFLTVNDFCIDLLDEIPKRYVGYSRFEKWIKDFFWYVNISPYDIWAEIRGVIKGHMGTNWYRNYIYQFEEYDGHTNQFLKSRGYVTDIEGDGKRLRCNIHTKPELEEAVTLIKNDGSLLKGDQIANDLVKIYSKSNEFRFKEHQEILIPETDYLNLDEKVSIFTLKERKTIYEIAVKYQQWIYDEVLFDDNDLAGRAILEIEAQGFEKFEFVVVDEVQDLTELQIYLISRLVNSLDDITFAGDIHQIINPTYYRNDRLKLLYYLNNKEIETAPLTKNYRSQKSITELCNYLGEIRKQYIAREKDITEQSISAMTDGNMPYYLNPGSNNLKEMLIALGERSDAAIIISAEEKRKELEGISGFVLPNIYTIQEIKGLERDYVFCYNLTTDYSDDWEVIFNKQAKKNSRYRYYFNIFYVAITRARENLCIFEEKDVFPQNLGFLDYFKEVEEFDEAELGLGGEIASAESWKEEAFKLEGKGKYNIAKRYFEKADSIVDAMRCQARSDFDEGSHSLALESLLEIGEYELAISYSEKARDTNRKILAMILLGKEDYKSIDKNFTAKVVYEIVIKSIRDSRFSDVVFTNYLEPKMQDSMDNINIANDITGKVIGNYGQRANN